MRWRPLALVERQWESEREYADPLRDVHVEVAFTSPTGTRMELPAFWKGGRLWGVRADLDAPGRWLYRVTASVRGDRGLHERRGQCNVEASAGPPLGRGLVPCRGHFALADGTPWAWLGDGAWDGLSASTDEDWARYLAVRRQQGFTAVQALLLPRHGSRAARWALGQGGPGTPNPEFFARLDLRVEQVVRHGLVPVLGLLPASSLEDAGNALDEASAVLLARYLLARYAAFHPVWLLAVGAELSGAGADRWRRVGHGVFAGQDLGPASILPRPGQLPDGRLLEADWLSFAAVDLDVGRAAELGRARRALCGPKPIVNLQSSPATPCADGSVTRRLWSSLLGLSAAGAGLTHPAVAAWRENGEGQEATWYRGLESAGSRTVSHLANWWARCPGYRLQPWERGAQPQSASPPGDILLAQTPDGAQRVALVPAGAPVPSWMDSPEYTGLWLDPASGAWWRPPARSRDPATRDRVLWSWLGRSRALVL